MTESNGGGQTNEPDAVEDANEKAPIAAAEPWDSRQKHNNYIYPHY